MPRKSKWTRNQKVTLLVALMGLLGAVLAALVGILPDWISLSSKGERESRTVTYSGRVLNAATGEPVSNARVTLEIAPVPQTRYTDSEGVYLFEITAETLPLPARITVSHENYWPYAREVQIRESGGQIETIQLQPLTSMEMNANPTNLPTRRSPQPDETGIWRMMVFQNKNLEGTPLYETEFPASAREGGGYQVQFNPLTDTIPGLGSGAYSIRWMGVFPFDDGYYEFHCEHRDGCRVFVDGRVWIDAWWDGAGGHDLARDISAGMHTVVVEFYDTSGVGLLEVSWWKK